MPLFIIKPVVWNTNSYKKPSGERVSEKSYPGQHGYGHEEWNNSPFLQFNENELNFRVFHTEDVGAASAAENAGQTFVFMIASHHGVQQLVGISGWAKFISSKEERRHLAGKLNINSFAKDAWALPRVKELGEDYFNQFWNRDVSWIPNWICPAEFFLWLDEPINLNASQLIGKNRLPTMYSSYMPVGREVAAKIMNAVPQNCRSEVWVSLMDAMQSSPEDFQGPSEGDNSLGSTVRLAEYQARIGQGLYRERLMAKWGRRCAVTELQCSALLRASHIKPWKDSTSSERLDADNGLLLAAHLDALFDRGLISFGEDGKMLISSHLPKAEKSHFDLPPRMKLKLNDRQRSYLEFHREKRFLE